MIRREQLANNAVSKLNGAITSIATSLTLKTGDGALFPAAGDFRLMLGEEILLCTARSGDTLTVVRGVEGTTAAPYGNQTPLASIVTTGAVQTYLADNLPWAGAQLPFRIADANGKSLQIGNALSAGDFGVVDPDHNSVVTQSGNAISVFKPSGSGIAAGMYLTRPLPSGAVIQLVACVDAGANNNSGWAGYKGIGFRCSTTGAVSLLQWCPTSSQVFVRKDQTGTDPVSTPYNLAPTSLSCNERLWIKAALVTDVGIGWAFYISNNGIDWILVWGGSTQQDDTFGGGVPDQLVFYCVAQNNLATSHTLLAWYEGYTADLPEAGLVAWYKLNDADPTGGLADSSGLGNHLQHLACGTWPSLSTDVPANLAGPNRGSVIFPLSGSGAVVVRDTTEGTGVGGWSFPFGYDPRTLSLWFKLPSSVSWSGVANCAFSYGTQNPSTNWSTNINPTSIGQDYDYGGSSIAAVPSQDVWHHLVIALPAGYPTNNPLYYLDSVSQSVSVSGNTSNDQLAQVAVGGMAQLDMNGSFPQYRFRGLLCDIRLYNRALTQAEVTNLYNGLNADGTTPVI
jgi:hypothetical protein